MKFTIENFFQFNGDGKAKAGFSVKTEGGLIYDCKLVKGGANGYFVVSSQSRAYDNKDGGKSYVNAFMALRDTSAARFFDDVAIQAKALLKVKDTFNQPQDEPYDEKDSLPF